MEYNKWLDKKPEIEEECIFIVAYLFRGAWEYNSFMITEYCEGGEDESDSMKCCFIVTNMNGEYYEDWEEIKADKYFLIKPLKTDEE